MLYVHRCRDGVRGAWEGDEESVALGVDLAAVPFGEGAPQDTSLVSQQGSILISQAIKQLGRAFYVGEQEGYRTFRELRERRIGFYLIRHAYPLMLLIWNKCRET